MKALILKLFNRKKEKAPESRRGFLKGLAAVPAIVALSPPTSATTQVAAAKQPVKILTAEELARKYDEDFGSPYLYVKANEDITAGDFVVRDRKSDDRFAVVRGINSKAILGVACVSAKRGDYFFIQDVGHMPILKEKKITYP